MVDKGKGIEKPKIVTISSACGSYSQHVEDVSDFDQTNGDSDGNCKSKDTESPYISSPTDPSLIAMANARAGPSRGARRDLELDEMDDNSEISAEHVEYITGSGPGEVEHNSEGSRVKGKGVERCNNARIGFGSLDLDEDARQDFFTDDEIINDTPRIGRRPSIYPEHFISSSNSPGSGARQPSGPQSSVAASEMNTEEELNQDYPFPSSPLRRLSSNRSSPNSYSANSSSVIRAENDISPHRSPRRGNTYDPTVLRGPQPVRFLNLEHGWIVPQEKSPPSPSSSRNSSGNDVWAIEDSLPYDDDVFEDSDGPPLTNQFIQRSRRLSFRGLDALEGIRSQTRDFGRPRDQGSSIPAAGLETVEEDENEDTEESNEYHSVQSSENWSAPGGWGCQSCGRLTPKSRVECYDCLSKKAPTVYSAEGMPKIQKFQDEEVFPEESVLESPSRTTLDSEASANTELQSEESGESHLIASISETPKNEEKKKNRKKKQKKKRR